MVTHLIRGRSPIQNIAALLSIELNFGAFGQPFCFHRNRLVLFYQTCFMEISTLFSVIAEGRVSFPVPVGDMTIEQIGVLMGGQSGGDLTGADMEMAHADT